MEKPLVGKYHQHIQSGSVGCEGSLVGDLLEPDMPGLNGSLAGDWQFVFG